MLKPEMIADSSGFLPSTEAAHREAENDIIASDHENLVNDQFYPQDDEEQLEYDYQNDT